MKPITSQTNSGPGFCARTVPPMPIATANRMMVIETTFARI